MAARTGASGPLFPQNRATLAAFPWLRSGYRLPQPPVQLHCPNRFRGDQLELGHPAGPGGLVFFGGFFALRGGRDWDIGFDGLACACPMGLR